MTDTLLRDAGSISQTRTTRNEGEYGILKVERTVPDFDSICGLPVAIRVAKLSALCQALELRCSAIPKNEWHLPMRNPVSEWGYSDNAFPRLGNHRKHEQSNYLMNIMDAVCLAYKKECHFYQFVILQIPSKDLVELSEIYVTRIGQGYAKNGGGLAHHGAGKSNFSKERYNGEDWSEFWDIAEARPMAANLRSADQEWVKRMDEGEKKNAELEGRIALARERQSVDQRIQELLNDPSDKETEAVEVIAEMSMLIYNATRVTAGEDV